MAKPLSAEAIEALLASQGVELAAGRAQRLAPGVNALNVDDPLRAGLPFEVDPTSYQKDIGK
jgi:hypothetical protein